MRELWPWLAAALVSAAVTIVAHERRWRAAFLLFKPLTTTLLWLATRTPVLAGSWLASGLPAALFFSLVGDVCLMWAAGFLPGLVAFLAALLTYAWAFSRGVPWTPWQLAYLAPPLVVAFWVVHSLWPHLARRRAPVVVYAAALALMAWRLVARLDAPDVSLAAWLVGVAGAGCFLCGDALLARRKFLQKPAPYALELGSYYAAQGLLLTAAALS